MRESSFGEHHLSLLDKLIFFIRERQFRKYVRGEIGTAVELGSGYTGTLLMRLLDRGVIREGIGVDLSVDQENNTPHLVLHEGDLNTVRVPCDDASADLVFSLAVIEHLNEPKHLVEEAYRLLSTGKTFILTTPSPLAKPVLEFMAYVLHIIDEKEIRDHKHYFTKRELRDLLSHVGFKEVRVKWFLFGLNTIAAGQK